jgi:nucleoid-associated protein YgaU
MHFLHASALSHYPFPGLRLRWAGDRLHGEGTLLGRITPAPVQIPEEPSMAGDPDFSDVSGGSSSSKEVKGSRTYTIAKGDSLSKIAKQFYGDAKQWKKIHEANKAIIKNPDLIHPGQVITIPDA